MNVLVIARRDSNIGRLFERLSGLEGVEVWHFDPLEDRPLATSMAVPPDILVLDPGLERATGLELLELLDQFPLPVLIPVAGGAPDALHYEMSPALTLISLDSSASELAEALKRLPDQRSLQVGDYLQLAIRLGLSVCLEIRLENRSEVILEIMNGDLWNATLDRDHAKALRPLLEQIGQRLTARPLDQLPAARRFHAPGLAVLDEDLPKKAKRRSSRETMPFGISEALAAELRTFNSNPGEPEERERNDPAMRVLLVEDAPGHALAKFQQEGVVPAERERTLSTPQDRQIELETVGDLEAGLDRLAAEVFDLLVLDLALPDSRGLETFGQARMRAGDLPIVVLVGLADLELGYEAVKRGASDYLVKERLDSILLVPMLRYARKRHQLSALWAAETLEGQSREANYRNLVAGIEHALVVTDAEANILFQNPRAAELLVLAEPDPITALMIDAARSEGVVAFEKSGEDGSVQHLEMRVAEIQWDGRSAFLLTLFESPTAATMVATRAVPQPVGELDQLIVDVASEQRGPLASISGFLELLSRGKVADPAVQQEFYDSMTQQVERLTSLTSHLPDLVQMGADRLRLEFGEIDFEGLVSEVVLAQQVRAREKDLTLEVSVPHGRRVRGDRDRLHEALAHVLDNAIKFSKGPGSIRITGEVGDQVTVRIADCGPGIPPEVRQQIFDRFFQASTEVKRDFGGAGIGLYKARKIIEAHGGRIGVDSDPGQGSTFYLSLPASPGTEPEPEVLVTHRESADVEAPAASASVRPPAGRSSPPPGTPGSVEAETAVIREPEASGGGTKVIDSDLGASDSGAEAMPGLHVIWLSGGSCEGCTMALLGASDPGIEDLLLGTIPDVPPVTLVHPALALESGDEYLAILDAVAAGERGTYVMVLEGVVFDESLAGDGYFSHMGEDEAGRPLTIGDWVDRLAPGAAALIAIGTCATGGGIPAALGSPTGAMSLGTYLGADFSAESGVPIINVPGCAPSGEAFIETVVAAIFHLRGLSPLELDEEQRPRWLYSQQVHPLPPRAHYLADEAYATEGRPTVGCPVPMQGWMNHVGGCANVGGACLGCTAPDFADRYLPLARLDEGSSVALVG